MATTEPAQYEARFLLRDVRWQFYETCVAEIGDRRVRLTYDRGNLEMMSPSEEHERYKHLLRRLIEVFTEELNIPIRGAASTTWKRQDLDRGLEPDECYYIQHEAQLRGKEEIDLAVDPPPDLALEIEITHSVLDRMSVYAALGIPEVWRFDGKTLRIHVLETAGRYRQRDRSPSLPLLPPTDVVRFLASRNETDETSWVRSFRAWVRTCVGTGR